MKRNQKEFKMYFPQELVLMRHGESVGNVANRASKNGDHSHFTPQFRALHSDNWELSRNGQKQAMKAGDWLRANGLSKFDSHLSSPLNRAIETSICLGLDNRIDECHFVRERAWGLLDVLTLPERNIAFNGNFSGRDRNPYHWCPPGGESIAQVVERAKLFFNNLPVYAPNARRVLVVCHGEMMWAFRILLEGISEVAYKTLHHSKVPGDKIYNCHVLHYKRNWDESQYSQLRSVCTYNPSRFDSGWQDIKKAEVAQ